MTGFFTFYIYIFNPVRHVISISSDQGPLITYQAYETLIKSLYKDYPFILTGFLEEVKSKKWTFLIEDPFDKTYNPAK